MKKILLQIIVIAIVFFAVSAFQQRNLLSTDHTPAPYFALPQLHEQGRYSIKELQGQTTVVYFFAPWCSICKVSMPNLQSAMDDGDINAVAIALDYQSEQQVQDFVADLSLSMPILLGSAQTAKQYKISAFPTYYVIDESLRITARSMGYSSELGIKYRGRDE
ncbi:TlpA family protein disulfide reductase [Pseudoalteromonas sp. CO325X]|uniref:TlpA family protein disulfide reductase n=1 Tax=Pseudoalteromonas sp. CO325X TaxID=1777262 RepID=UPI0010234B54|nr:TlpA disulfide reductase family protein [Pseudoalteromonas sp. CO325X]RZF77334.1 TlpA family protein disulfide reductase [Pseudoalteromonas sp. CO325X]